MKIEDITADEEKFRKAHELRYETYGNLSSNKNFTKQDYMEGMLQKDTDRFVAYAAFEGEKIIGFAIAKPYALFEQVPQNVVELCRFTIHPDFQGRGIGKALSEKLRQFVRENKTDARYSIADCVTNHQASQKLFSDFQAVCLIPNWGQDTFGTGYPSASLTAVRDLNDSVKRPRTVYVPENHREFVQRIYADLGIAAKVIVGTGISGREPLTDPPLLKAVDVLDSSAWKQFDFYERNGYFFCGILPEMTENELTSDIAVFNRLPSFNLGPHPRTIDPAAIKVIDRFAHMKDFVLENYRKVLN